MFGLRGCWMPISAMIPKADGDSTPLGQTTPLCSSWCAQKGCGPRSRLGHLWDWVEGWLPESVFLVWVMVSLRWKLGSATALDIEEVLSGDWWGSVACNGCRCYQVV